MGEEGRREHREKILEEARRASKAKETEWQRREESVEQRFDMNEHMTIVLPL